MDRNYATMEENTNEASVGRCNCGKKTAAESALPCTKVIPGTKSEMRTAATHLLFRATDRFDNVKIITEQNLGDGRLVVIPRNAKYQVQNNSNYLFHINFNKP